jgi:putative ATP-binding cassette transporter
MVQDTGEQAASGVLHQVRLILRALQGAPVRRALLALALAVTAVIVVTAYMQIRLNLWNKPFFDALSRRDLHEFLFQLGVFFVIAGILLVLNVAQRWLVETLKVRLREGLVQGLLAEWLQPRRAFWLAHGGPMGVNPDQRIHEDARKLCDLSADLGAGLVQAAILFASFAGLLWVLSSSFSFHFAGAERTIPGFMLWSAILYAGVGSALSYRVGGSLIDRNAERYAREADLRFALVRVNEHLDGIALAGGEEDERRRVQMHLSNALAATRRIVSGLTHLTWVTAGFGWVTIVAPILVPAPLYFSGKITFGGLMMAAGAFTQAQSSLRWFVDNFSTIADWRATLLRVANFRQALLTAAVIREFDSSIRYAETDADSITIEGLEIASPEGGDMLRERHVVLRPGERVLIVGAPGTSKTLLFRALAGLWPWGAGILTRPKGSVPFFLPRGTPYLPRGTLREVLAYPQSPERFDAEACRRALVRFGLERLAPELEATRRWDRDLNQDEQLALAFARMLLQAPAWVLLDDTLGLLDDEAVERMTEVFGKELRHTGVIHIGRAAHAREPLFTRVLHLVRIAPSLSAARAQALEAARAARAASARSKA